MAESITTITDKSQFGALFTANFLNNSEIFVKTKSGDLKIQYLGFTDDNVAIRIPRVKNVPDTILVFARNGDNTVYVSLKVIESTEDTFVFLPIKFQIIAEKRREDRIEAGAPSGKDILYVSNIMSDSYIQSALQSAEKKVDYVKERITYDLRGKFDRLRIIMINEMQFDPRMKHLQETRMPLFVNNLNGTPEPKYEKDFAFYKAEIYAKDYKLASQKELISEISIPIIYRNFIAYGYIQVNNATPMTEAHLSVMKRMATSINELFLKDNIFEPAKEKFLVSDISKGGLGIVFKDRRQTRYFRKDSMVSLDVILPTQKRATLGVVIRNTTFMDNGIIKIGAQIVNIDAISEVNYDEYLEKLKA